MYFTWRKSILFSAYASSDSISSAIARSPTQPLKTYLPGYHSPISTLAPPSPFPDLVAHGASSSSSRIHQPPPISMLTPEPQQQPKQCPAGHPPGPGGHLPQSSLQRRPPPRQEDGKGAGRRGRPHRPEDGGGQAQQLRHRRAPLRRPRQESAHVPVPGRGPPDGC